MLQANSTELRKENEVVELRKVCPCGRELQVRLVYESGELHEAECRQGCYFTRPRYGMPKAIKCYDCRRRYAFDAMKKQ